MSSKLEENDLYCFIKEFPDIIKTISNTTDVLQSLKRLLNGAPELLTVYPSWPAVIEVVCLALIEAVHIKEAHHLVIDFDDSADALVFIATSLTQVQWLTLPLKLIRLACIAVTTMLTLYTTEQSLNAISSVALLLQECFTLFAQGDDSNEHLIALGSSFPTNLPSVFYDSFIEFGIFEEIHNLIRLYTEMCEEDFTDIIKVISSFLQVNPSVCGSALISDSTHFMLLFAAQHFPSVYEVQESIWHLLTVLFARGGSCYQFIEELDPSALVSAVHSTLTSSDCGLCPIVHFLGDYIITSDQIDPPFVVYCLESYSKLFDVLFIYPLNPSRRSSHLSANDRDIIRTITKLFEFFFQDFSPKYSTIEYIFKYQLLEVLKQASLAWPDLCCLSYCTAFHCVLEQFHPNEYKSTLTLKLEEDIKKEFFGEENKVLLQFIDLLCNPGTYASTSIRVAICHLISSLLKTIPIASLEPCGLNGEFLMSYISGFSRDVREIPEKIHDFLSLTHQILHCLKPDQLRIIRDQKWHELVVSCLASTITNRLAPTAHIELCACILQKYLHTLNDTMPFITDCNFAQLTLRLAHNYDIINLFNVIVLSLTADQKASFALFESSSFVTDLIPFIQDPANVETAVNAIGNVLLSNDKAKLEMVNHGLHVLLLEFLDFTPSDGYHPLTLSSCCRVLHILAMADNIKYILIENNLTKLLLKLIDTIAVSDPIVHCHALGILKCLEYFTLHSTQKYIFPEKIQKSFAHLLKANSHTKDDCYIVYVFLLSLEEETISVVEVFSQVLQEGSPDEFTRLSQWLPRLHGNTTTTPIINMVTVPMTSKLLSLSVDEQLLLASYMEHCIASPVKPQLMKCHLSDDEVFKPQPSHAGPTNTSDVSSTSYVDDLHAFPTFLEGPKLIDVTHSELTLLGLNPANELFRFGRFYCNTYSECSFSPVDLTPQQYQVLIDKGWYRRGGEGMYRFQKGNNFDVCEWETRVTIAEFDYRKHKSYKKVLKRMPEDRLTVKTVPTQFIPEAFDLYNNYQSKRHGFRPISKEAYYRKCVDSPLRNQSIDGFHYGSFHQLYYLDGVLVAVGVIDIVPNGVLSMYMWYSLDKHVSKYSFGIYSTLKEIEFARNLSKCNPNIKYYYLQGWRHTNSRLSYKAKYEPEEFYCPGIVSDWVQGLDNVMQEIAKAKQKWLQLCQEGRNLLSDEFDIDSQADRVCIPGNAHSIDREAYHAHYGPDEPDVINIVVCLDHQVYMYLGQMLDTFAIEAFDRWRVIKYFKGLYYAVGPKLAQNMIVDFKTSSSTGYPVGLGLQ